LAKSEQDLGTLRKQKTACTQIKEHRENRETSEVQERPFAESKTAGLGDVKNDDTRLAKKKN